jgi:GT2 family glycosyltransferase
VIPRTVFEELGGFDEDFFASHEDVDLSYRARLLGYPCRYVADSVVRHHGSATLGRVSEFAVFHGQRNLEWMYFKNTPGPLLLRTLPGHLIYTAAAAVHFTRHGLFRTFSARSGRRLSVYRDCCASAHRCSAHDASVATRSGLTSSHAGSRPSVARSNSI